MGAMISSLMSALAPRVAYGPAGGDEPSGTSRFSTAVNVSDSVGAVIAPAGNARVSSGGSGSGSGDGEAGFQRGSRPAGAYVPPLSREAGDDAGSASAHPQDETPLEAAMPATRWMSAAMPQPDAVSFAGFELGKIDGADTGTSDADAAFAAERRANLDYLVASMKSMQEGARDATPAMRHAVAAYADV